jgi:hypothetical protein
LNEIDSTLFWLRMGKLLVEIAGLALIGQGATHLLIRMMGQSPQENSAYRLFQILTGPVVKPCRWITPRFIPDTLLPLVAFALLAAAYVWLVMSIANTCVGAGLPVAQCVQKQ